jgi:hypothetical protein
LELYKDTKRKDYEDKNDKNEPLLILYDDEGTLAHITDAAMKARTNTWMFVITTVESCTSTA